MPAAEPIGNLPAVAGLGVLHFQDVVLEQPRQHAAIEWAEGMELTRVYVNTRQTMLTMVYKLRRSAEKRWCLRGYRRLGEVI
ncbi:MAG: hypothetical protein JSU96_00165, partial [Acidobacteriota bacterium]